MSIFAEALARKTGSGLTGQAALAALYEEVPRGTLKAADLLPIASQIMSERAAPKIQALRKTSMAEQGRGGSVIQDLLYAFSKSGGEEGFARFFRSVTAALEKLTPVVEALGKAFNWFSKQLEGPILLIGDMGRMFDTAGRSLGQFKTQLDDISPAIAQFAGFGALILTRWGRLAALVFTPLYLVLEDIAGWVNGRDSAIGYLMDWLEQFVSFDKGIMGVALSFLAVGAAIKVASKIFAASALWDLLNPDRKNKTKKTPTWGDAPEPGGNTKSNKSGGKWAIGTAIGATLGRVGLPLTLLAAYWGMNSEEFQQRMQQDYDFQQIVNGVLAPLVPGMVALGGGQDPRLNMLSPDQRAEYIKGRSRPSQQGLWENLDGYLDYKSSKDAQWKLDNQHLSDIPSIPTVETALGQTMQQPMNNTNNITNTFEINIDGVLDPSGLEGVMTNQIIPQFEIFFNNQLQLVDTSFGSK